MNTPYVSPYLMQSPHPARLEDHVGKTPEEVLADDTLTAAEKSLYLDRMEQDAIAAITIEDDAVVIPETMRPTLVLEAIKTARRSLSQSA